LKSEIWRWVVVVDEDINPMDLQEVIWAISWRNEFPEVCESSPALKEQTLGKWRKSLEHDK